MLMYVDPHSTVVKITFFLFDFPSQLMYAFYHITYIFISFYDPYVIFSIPVLLYLFFIFIFFIIHIFIPMKKKFIHYVV